MPLQESAEAKLSTLEHLKPNSMKVSAVSKPEIVSKRLDQSLPHQLQCRTLELFDSPNSRALLTLPRAIWNLPHTYLPRYLGRYMASGTQGAPARPLQPGEEHLSCMAMSRAAKAHIGYIHLVMELSGSNKTFSFPF